MRLLVSGFLLLALATITWAAGDQVIDDARWKREVISGLMFITSFWALVVLHAKDKLSGKLLGMLVSVVLIACTLGAFGTKLKRIAGPGLEIEMAALRKELQKNGQVLAQAQKALELNQRSLVQVQGQNLKMGLAMQSYTRAIGLLASNDKTKKKEAIKLLNQAQKDLPPILTWPGFNAPSGPSNLYPWPDNYTAVLQEPTPPGGDIM